MYADLTDALNMTGWGPNLLIDVKGKGHQFHISSYESRRETTPLDADYLLRGYGVAGSATSVAPKMHMIVFF